MNSFWIKHEWDGCNSSIPNEYDGKWIFVTNGECVSIERFKVDAIDHFYPESVKFSIEETTYWAPIPPVPINKKPDFTHHTGQWPYPN